MTTPTPDWLAGLRAAEAKASPAPWRASRDDEHNGAITYALLPPNDGATVAWVPEDCNDNARADAHYLASLRNAAPRLLAVAEAARRVVCSTNADLNSRIDDLASALGYDDGAAMRGEGG